jgi:hypothetical protein
MQKKGLEGTLYPGLLDLCVCMCALMIYLVLSSSRSTWYPCRSPPAPPSLLFGFVFFLSDSTRFGVFAPCYHWLANLGI